MPMRTCSESAGVCSFSSSIASRNAEARPNRALDVVLVRDRRSEHGHDRLAGELLDGAAVALDLLPQAGVAPSTVRGVGRRLSRRMRRRSCPSRRRGRQEPLQHRGIDVAARDDGNGDAVGP